VADYPVSLETRRCAENSAIQNTYNPCLVSFWGLILNAQVGRQLNPNVSSV
jgi:hypothetical protein